MPFDMELTLYLSVDSEDEAQRVMDAAYSGLAAQLIKLGVLYGQIPVGGVVQSSTTPPPISAEELARQEAKKREASIELKRVEERVGRVTNQIAEEAAPREHPTGLLGRKRFGRS